VAQFHSYRSSRKGHLEQECDPKGIHHARVGFPEAGQLRILLQPISSPPSGERGNTDDRLTDSVAVLHKKTGIEIKDELPVLLGAGKS